MRDLPERPDRPCSVRTVRVYLKSLEETGVNHFALNLCFNQADNETTLKRLADGILPDFAD
jgi:hypothetical protein